MPSELSREKTGAETLMRAAVSQHSKRAQELSRDRARIRQEIEDMINKQEADQLAWEQRQEEYAESPAILEGAIQGAMTGGSLGALSGNPMGAGIGAVVGGVGGALYGAFGGRQRVAEAAPYTAGISNLASQYKGYEDSKARHADLMGLYNKTDYPLRAPQTPAPALDINGGLQFNIDPLKELGRRIPVGGNPTAAVPDNSQTALGALSGRRSQWRA